MATNRPVSLLLYLCWIQALLTTHCEAAYQGCFPEDQKQRKFDTNPGDYEPDSLTISACTAICGTYDKQYAALTEGRFCFCGASEPQLADKVDNSFCQELCSGDPAFKCGGKGYVSVFDATSSITDLKIASDAATPVPVGTAVAFTISVGKGTNVYYQMDYGDGAGLSEKNATDFETRTYFVPGTYGVSVEANDYNDTLPVQRAGTSVVVQAPVVDVDLECDPAFATFDEGKCVATVWQGTGLSLTAEISSDTATITFPTTADFSAIADPVLSQVGPAVPTKDSLQPFPKTDIILAQASLVEKPGRVIGWEFNVKTIGTFKVLILSATCSDYCPWNNECDSGCSDAEAYAVTCSNDKFCPRARLCETSGTCTAPSLFSATAMNIPSYTVTAMVDVEVTSTGYQYVAETGMLDVKAGDILGLDLDSSVAEIFSVDCVAERTDFKTTGSVAVGTVITTSGLTATGVCVAMRAVVSEGSKVFFFYSFDSHGDYNLTATAENVNIPGSPVSNSTTFQVQEGVNFTIIDGATYASTGVPTTFSVMPHTGAMASYNWSLQCDSGQSDSMMNDADQSKDFTFTSTGNCTLEVTTFNAVSNKTNVTVIIVQDAVTGLNVTAPTAAVGEVHTFQITLTGGSDYTCAWTFGDGATDTTDFVSTPVATTPVTHTYNAAGDREFSVTCANDVSNETIAFTQKVQERITGLHVPPGQDQAQPLKINVNVTTGTDIQWSLTFDGNPITLDQVSTYSWAANGGSESAGTHTVTVYGGNDINNVSHISQPYVLTQAVAGLLLSASTSNTTTGTVVSFTVSITAGSNVNMTIDYDDGSSEEKTVNGPTTENFNHAFTDGDIYHVTVHATNEAGTETAIHDVWVLQGVSDIALNCSMFTFALYTPPANVLLVFNSSGPKPTEGTYDIQYQDTKPLIEGDIELPKFINLSYYDTGVYDLTANVNSLVDQKTIQCTVTVIEPLNSPVITLEFSKVPKGQPFAVTFCLYRGPSRPYCNLTLDSGDPVMSKMHKEREGSGENGCDTFSVTYPTAGSFTLSVTATTELETITESKTVKVIDPVLRDDLDVVVNSLQIPWGNKVEVTITLTAGTPTHPVYVTTACGNRAEEQNNFVSPITLQCEPETDGQMELNITVYNDASSELFPYLIDVCKDFEGMSTTVCSKPDMPYTAACSVNEPFTVDKVVQFLVNTNNNAKASIYKITATMGSEHNEYNSTANPFELSFLEAGNWDVEIEASNALFVRKVTTTIVVQTRVVGFQFSLGTDSRSATKTFDIAFTEQGVGTCLTVDLGDGTMSAYADNSADCTEPGFLYRGALSSTRTIVHTYSDQNTYRVIAKAKNSLNTVEQELDCEFTALDCSTPKVILDKGSDSLYDAILQVRRNDIFEVHADLQFYCGYTFDNLKTWTSQTVDRDWGTVIQDDDISGLDATKSDFVITPSVLDYGVHKLTFTAAMATSSVNNFEASAHIYIEIVLSPLVGMMVDGGYSEITRGQSGPDLDFRPLDWSYDPDAGDGQPALSGMSVTNWTCTYKNGSAAGPCTNLVNAASAGASGRLQYSVSKLEADETYSIIACMEKDVRAVCSTINVVVRTGDPPLAFIKCKGGTICIQEEEGYMVLMSSSLSLTAECTNCGSSGVSYYWNLMAYDYRWIDRLRIFQDDEKENHVIGYTSREILLTPSYFYQFEQYSEMKMELLVTSNGETGSVASKIVVNHPPQHGNCFVEPKEMAWSINSQALISCGNWSDSHGIASYRLYYNIDDQTVDVQLMTIKTSDHFIDRYVTLPQGRAEDDYKITVLVDIADIYGAVTNVSLGQVKVTPPTEEGLTEVTNEILSGEGPVVQSCKQGDSKLCLTLVTKVAAGIIPDDYTRENGPPTLGTLDRDRSQVKIQLSYEEERNVEVNRVESASVLQSMVELVTDLSKSTVESLQQDLSTIAQCTQYPTQVNIKTQDVVMDYIDNVLDLFETMTPRTPEAHYKMMENFVDLCGNVMAALSSSITDSNVADKEECSKTSDAFNILNQCESSCTGKCSDRQDMDYAIRNQKQQACCELRKESMEIKGKTVLNKVMQAGVDDLHSNGVLGETKSINTAHIKVKFKKATVTNAFSGLDLDDSESGAEFEEGFVPPGMNEDDEVIVKAMLMTTTVETKRRNWRNLDPNSCYFTLKVFTSGKTNTATAVGRITTSTKIKIKIRMAPGTPTNPTQNISPVLTSWNKFQLHNITLKGNYTLLVKLCRENTSVQYVVVINNDYIPDPSVGNCTMSFLVPSRMPDTTRCTTLKITSPSLNDESIQMGIRQLADSELDINVDNCSALPHWEKGSENATTFTGNYTLSVDAAICNSISEDSDDWEMRSCIVSTESNENRTVCECNHLTTFAGGWVVVPNTINWDYVFSNLDFFKNPTLYITEIVIILVYILAAVWARRKDKKDVEKLGIAPLMDNDPKDRYYYEIVVVTGMRRNAGTDSKVFFILSGEEDETDVRQFTDQKRKIFRRGDTNGFLMATPRPLGYLNYARVWHDNSGKGSFGSWYLNYMIVRDVQTDEKWVFIADKWFAVEESDGQVDRIIPVATRENMTEFSHLFAEKTRKNLADGHLWFSVVARPPASRFTCLQRVSCCLCLLYVSMLANAMFYNTTPDSGNANGFTLGPFSVTPEQIFIGVASNLIVFPVNFIIITLFRKSRPRRLRPSRVDEAIKTAHDGPRNEASVTDIKPEVSSIFSVSRPASMMANNPKPLRPESSLSRPGTSLSTRADATLPTKKKKSKSLPWGCRIVAWVLLWVSVIVSAAIVTAYGITFKDETCKKWISSMLISFFMSVFITQPIKVFMLAIFLSLIIKNPGEEEEDEEQKDEEKTKLANDEIPLHDLNSDSFGAARPRKIGYKPPDRSTLEAARQKRLNEIQMWAIVREVVIYSFFLWILMVISYRQRNANTFLYKDTMERVFIRNNETDIDFAAIRNVDEYWNWARSGLVNGIRPGPYYNDYPPLLLWGYVNDKVSKILGYAVMRQLRIRPSLCEMDERMMAVIRECNVGYDVTDQEEGTFDIGWKRRTENSTANDTAAWYSYTDADSLNGYPYWGQLSVYAGGGYVVSLKGSKDDLIQVMNRLEAEKWIDRYTRAVFVEFTTYNAQVNLFGIATILAEFHQTGGVVQTYRFEPAMLLPYMTSAMLFQLVCEGAYCCFIIFFLVRLIRTFIKEKLSFFKGFWNLVELSIITMSLTAIVIYFYRLIETNRLTSRFKETQGLEYIKFQYVGYWNELFSYMIGLTVFFSTIKFMRLLRFNKRMSLLASTLRNGARSLLHFSIIFWIVFLAFTMLFFLSFMTIDIKYSSFVGSMVSGILMMMGKFDIYAMTMAEPVLTQVFVFLFVLSLTFIIVNMFVSILNETFSSVREDVHKQSNDYEIISFMISRFKHFTGLGPRTNITLTPEELRNQELEKRYAEGRGNSCVDDFPDRIDRLLHSISNVYMEQEHMTAMMDKRGYQGRGAKGGHDNPAFVGPNSKTRELSKVHTH